MHPKGEIFFGNISNISYFEIATEENPILRLRQKGVFHLEDPGQN